MSLSCWTKPTARSIANSPAERLDVVQLSHRRVFVALIGQLRYYLRLLNLRLADLPRPSDELQMALRRAAIVPLTGDSAATHSTATKRPPARLPDERASSRS